MEGSLSDKAKRIKQLNDAFRTTFQNGKVMMTCGVDALSPDAKLAAMLKVREFSDFSANNDPYGEHDFGSFEVGGDKFFWKIDLYEEPDVKSANGEPVVTRVLTIMLAEEY
jgi:hypothetical protein